MFTTISTYYDIINTLFTFNLDKFWRDLLISTVLADSEDAGSAAGDPPGPAKVHLLDVATGTCEVIKAVLASPYGANVSSVTGVDPSVGMLNVCHAKLSSSASTPFPGSSSVSLSHLAPPVTLHLGDIQTINLSSSSSSSPFTHATVSFGIRNVPDRGAAMCNIWRHMTEVSTTCDYWREDDPSICGGYSSSWRGGKLGVLEVSYSPTFFSAVSFSNFSWSTPLKLLVSNFIHYVVPMIGYVVSGGGPQYQHLVDSLESFPENFDEEVEGYDCSWGERRGGWKSTKTEVRNLGSIKIYLFEAVLR